MPKASRRRPCGNCPFRREAPLAHWHPDEYRMLARHEQNPTTSNLFGCHKDARLPDVDRELCVGWLLYQRSRGVPSIALRVRLLTHPEVMNQLDEAEPDGPMYESIAELVAANLERDRELHPARYHLRADEVEQPNERERAVGEQAPEVTKRAEVGKPPTTPERAAKT